MFRPYARSRPAEPITPLMTISTQRQQSFLSPLEPIHIELHRAEVRPGRQPKGALRGVRGARACRGPDRRRRRNRELLPARRTLLSDDAGANGLATIVQSFSLVRASFSLGRPTNAARRKPLGRQADASSTFRRYRGDPPPTTFDGCTAPLVSPLPDFPKLDLTPRSLMAIERARTQALPRPWGVVDLSLE